MWSPSFPIFSLSNWNNWPENVVLFGSVYVFIRFCNISRFQFPFRPIPKFKMVTNQNSRNKSCFTWLAISDEKNGPWEDCTSQLERMKTSFFLVVFLNCDTRNKSWSGPPAETQTNRPRFFFLFLNTKAIEIKKKAYLRNSRQVLKKIGLISG